MNIKDIARLAGVGVSTVSRVMNNHPDVKQDTRERIIEIIKEHNYIPNNSARILKQTHTKDIGVLVKGVFNPFFSEMVKRIGEAIEKTEYTMIFQQDDNEGEDIDSLISFIKEKKLKGVIYLGGNFDQVPKERFEQVDCKIVVLCSNMGDNFKNLSFSSVGINDYQDAYEAMSYIIGKGRTSIGLLIGEQKDVGVGRERLKGYLEAAQDLGIAKESLYIIEGHYNYKEAYEQTLACLRENKEITAVCSLSDTMAVGAAKAILDNGSCIGEEIGIVGFDGMDIAKYYNPSLTTVEQPREEMAKIGINLLLELLKDKRKHEHILLETVLLERASC
ncbi:MAG: LacI family DNA-binding transcriptional regulator [Cellulosilyticaceae bacterium]